MYGTQTGIQPSTLWLALAVGLLVQGLVIYVAVRLALEHHRKTVKAQDENAARTTRRRAELDAAAELKQADAPRQGPRA